MQVKGIKISLRPFNKSGPEPTLPTSSAYLKCHIWGHVKVWHIEAVEDMRMMSIAQINEAYDIDDWLFTVYGADLDEVPAPSTPASRPRATPKQPGLPPRGDDAALLPQVHDRLTILMTNRRRPSTRRNSLNIKKVLERLPKLVEEGADTSS